MTGTHRKSPLTCALDSFLRHSTRPLPSSPMRRQLLAAGTLPMAPPETPSSLVHKFSSTRRFSSRSGDTRLIYGLAAVLRQRSGRFYLLHGGVYWLEKHRPFPATPPPPSTTFHPSLAPLMQVLAGSGGGGGWGLGGGGDPAPLLSPIKTRCDFPLLSKFILDSNR